MSQEAVARRYAGALADVAIKNGSTDDVRRELNAWDQMISENADLKAAFSNPSISHSNKEKVLEALIAKSGPSTTTANFLRVLLQNSRLTELSAINQKLHQVVDERSGLISGSVTSARPLNDDEKQKFKGAVESKTGKQVNLSFQIDENLIGGAVTRVGSTVYDGSVRSQLDNLRNQMIKN